MKKLTSPWNYLEFEGLDLELLFCTELLKLRSLHYGYWNAHAKPRLRNLRKAQQRYTDTLIKLVPHDVVNILDVGCGIGDVAHAFLKRGYLVTAISPDKNHQRYFANPTENLSFISTTFEEFTSAEQYDLILMSESQNYFPTDIGFQQSRRYLKPNGYLLVSGIFRREASKAFQDAINTEQGYLEKARQYGFRILRRHDITKQVLPTLVLAHSAIEEYVKPFVDMIDYYLRSSASFKSAILRMLMRRHIDNGFNILRHYEERTDPSLFERACRYLRLLLQRT